MLTVLDIIEALKKVPDNLLKAPVRFATSVHEVDKGPQEGSYHVNSRPVTGVALAADGLYIFVNPEGANHETFLVDFPEGFMTGNSDIDNRLRGIEPGDEWKSPE